MFNLVNKPVVARVEIIVGTIVVGDGVVGAMVVGCLVGIEDGESVVREGALEPVRVGPCVGSKLGILDGTCEGDIEGTMQGSGVTSVLTHIF